jgi:hypothetical protein
MEVDMTPDLSIVDTVSSLRRGPLGNARCTREFVDSSQWETVWVVYDESRRLTPMSSVPAVEFRAGAFDEGGVVVVPVLLRLGLEARGPIYDTYIHAYDIEGGNLYLQDLARQEAIRMHLYDEQARLRDTLTVANSLRTLAQRVLERQYAYQPSTPAAFEYARDKLYDAHIDVQGLWQALGRG